MIETGGSDDERPSPGAFTHGTVTGNAKPQRDLPEEVKNLGRKARARLEEERQNRREIQRVESDQQDPVAARTNEKSALIAESIRKPVKVASPRKSSWRKSSSGAVTSADVEDKNVDRWIPDITHISSPTSREACSTVVQLHGLPVGVTPTHIRRFFSGLEPQRILVLPSNTATLPALDARHNAPRKTGLTVERHSALLRVLVKFDSAPTAMLASQRSGEVLQIDSSGTGASIGITHIVKDVANDLVQKLAVDGEPNDPLKETLERIESGLDPMVPKILWAAAIADLKLKVEGKDHSGGTFLYQLKREVIGQPDEEDLGRQRESLSRHIRQLLNTPPFPAAEPLDPTLLHSDAILSLCNSCVDILKTELKRIDDQIYKSSRIAFLENDEINRGKEDVGIG